MISETLQTRRAFLQGLLSLGAFASAPVSAAPWIDAFKGLYPEDEHGFVPLSIQGSVPSELRGTLYRAGAMRFSSPDGTPYGHWFDGDGGIYAFRLDGSHSAQAAIKLVDSVGLQKEEAKNKVGTDDHAALVVVLLSTSFTGDWTTLAGGKEVTCSTLSTPMPFGCLTRTYSLLTLASDIKQCLRTSPGAVLPKR